MMKVHTSQNLRLSPRERLWLGNVADLYEITRKKLRVTRARQGPHVRYDQGVEHGIRGLTVGDFEPSRVRGSRPPSHNPLDQGSSSHQRRAKTRTSLRSSPVPVPIERTGLSPPRRVCVPIMNAITTSS
jgi:hypothetical protein